MTAMRAVPLRSARTDAVGMQVLRPGGQRHLIAIKANVSLAQDATVWLPALVPVAMSVGETLVIDGEVDALALAGAAQAQRILAGWFPQWRVVEVRAATAGADVFGPNAVAANAVDRTAVNLDPVQSPPTRAPSAPLPSASEAAEAVGCFFSAGVDSTFAALSPEVTHLIYVRGFDTPLRGSAGEATVEHVRAVAKALGKPLIEVETDLRATLDQYAPWGQAAHGPAMATVASALRQHFAKVIFPGAWPVDQTPVWGTHPELDPLWSSSELRVVNDSTHIRRVDKVRTVAQRPELVAGLRVCWQNSGELNCGECEKCLRTMVALYAVEALGEARLFPPTIDVARVAALPGGLVASFFARENVAALREMPLTARDRELEAAVARIAGSFGAATSSTLPATRRERPRR